MPGNEHQETNPTVESSTCSPAGARAAPQGVFWTNCVSLGEIGAGMFAISGRVGSIARRHSFIRTGFKYLGSKGPSRVRRWTPAPAAAAS